MEKWLSEVSTFLRMVPAVRELIPSTPFYWMGYTGVPKELEPALNRLDRQLQAVRGIAPTLETYAKELHGQVISLRPVSP